ncbi:MAG: glutamate synthase-related protein, partial [Myxococcota bacterium]|nr:glutamate synthase-related protein [Myxococcota bacterium]
ASEPMRLSHLLAVRRSTSPTPIEEIESVRSITRRFGSGAMSFGALSAEAQRDIFHAMTEVGGRSNSGEGGENPYYFVDGTRATTKQVASGRFGVTAEYLMTGNEIEIKLAQGAKPGEGGQLMGIKVNADIARARHAHEGVDLISPPPLHDIYSIEDLKELIYELRQLNPQAQICVKLVAGANIGNIAVGVVKAGADIIQVSGGSGGTGAASLSSMMHAGLPWELGLVEVHQTLLENRLRDRVRLRVDGGLHVGMDLIIAALLGADEYGFGKLLLVAQGCIMARICEKNRCPRGIATHDPKFKDKYRGRVLDIVTMLDTLAEDVRGHLSSMGVSRLSDIIGQANVYLRPRSEHLQLIEDYHLDLTAFLHGTPNHVRGLTNQSSVSKAINPLNQEITTQVMAALHRDEAFEGDFDIRSTDRAIPATLSGMLARKTHERRMAMLNGVSSQRESLTLPEGRVRLNLTGSAGQGFGAFMVSGLDIRLRGEANDSVAKSMSGGLLVVQPVSRATFKAHRQVILGNCALYGATGGTLMVHGRAGDRFAVRNSGATAIVEGAGLHACEYMTSGTVVILGDVSHNIGAGMTGGVLYLRESQAQRVNNDYCGIRALTPADTQRLQHLLSEYLTYTQSETAAALLRDGDALDDFVCCLPLKSLEEIQTEAKGVA